MNGLLQDSIANRTDQTGQNSDHRLPIVALLAFLAALVAFGQGSAWAADSATVVGTAERGTNAVEYIGKIQQVGPYFSAVGYLTYVRGLDAADLFTNPLTPDVSTARFTFSGDSIAVSHAQVGTVTQIDSTGSLTIYFNEYGGADFNNPGSFSSGTEIASLDARGYNVLTVIAPNQGVTSATVDTVQRNANRFLLNGRRLQFGHPRLVQRATIAGGATRSQIDPPVSSTDFAAAAVTP